MQVNVAQLNEIYKTHQSFFMSTVLLWNWNNIHLKVVAVNTETSSIKPHIITPQTSVLCWQYIFFSY